MTDCLSMAVGIEQAGQRYAQDHRLGISLRGLIDSVQETIPAAFVVLQFCVHGKCEELVLSSIHDDFVPAGQFSHLASIEHQGKELQILREHELFSELSELLPNALSFVASQALIREKQVYGAIHFLHTEDWEYSDATAAAIGHLAQKICQRIEHYMGPEREERRESLMRRAVSPAFAELRNALVPLHLGASDLRIVAEDMQGLFEMIASSSDEVSKRARLAYEDFGQLIDEMNRAAQRVKEVSMAVEGLWGEGGRNVVLSDLLKSAAALAMHTTRLVGGVEMPAARPEYSIRARKSVATASLSLLLVRCAEANASGGMEVQALDLDLEVGESHFVLSVEGAMLRDENCEEIAAEVGALLLGDRDLDIAAVGCKLKLTLQRAS